MCVLKMLTQSTQDDIIVGHSSFVDLMRSYSQTKRAICTVLSFCNIHSVERMFFIHCYSTSHGAFYHGFYLYFARLAAPSSTIVVPARASCAVSRTHVYIREGVCGGWIFGKSEIYYS